MFRFGLSSVLGTLVDFAMFSLVFRELFDLFYAELLSASCGMVVNFFMHKRFVFQLERKAYTAFFLSIAFSFAVMLLGAWMITGLALIPLLAENILIAKVIVIGSKFGLNYFSKRWVFERKVFKD